MRHKLKVALVAVLTEERRQHDTIEIKKMSLFIFKQVEQSKDVVAAPMETHLSTVLKSAITDRVVRVDHGDKAGAKRAIYNCDHCGRKLKRTKKIGFFLKASWKRCEVEKNNLLFFVLFYKFLRNDASNIIKYLRDHLANKL